MVEDAFDVSLASEEEAFLYQFGINNGFSLSYLKITRCYFLSSNAKQLYQNIKNYAYNGKKDSYPSQLTLMAELGWSKQTLINYTRELEDLGFIKTERRVGKPMLYKFQELHKVPVLMHSEIVHGIREAIYKNDRLFFKVLEEYKESDLFKEVSLSPKPIEYKNKIISWFKDKKIMPVQGVGVDEIADQPVEEQGEQYKKEGGQGKKEFKDTPISEWNTNHFASYFAWRYKQKFGTPYNVSVAERGQLKRLLDSYGEDKEIIKRQIDAFLDMDYFQVKRLLTLTSGWAQSVLNRYLSDGYIPPIKIKQEKGTAKQATSYSEEDNPYKQIDERLKKEKVVYLGGGIKNN